MNSKTIAEPSNGDTISSLSSLASEYQIQIIAGLALIDGADISNVAVFIDKEGTLQSQYIKNYPFSFAGEDKHYRSSDRQVIFDLEGLQATTFICYDLRFPELFRSVAKRVDMIFVIANWPEPRQAHWITLLKARAIENQCFIIGVNRIGKDQNNLNYIGGSMVIDPWGEEISIGSLDQEYIVTKIDAEKTKTIREKFPFLNDIKN